MRGSVLAGLLLGSLVACAQGGGANPAPPQQAAPVAAEQGRKAYTSYCVRCHGIGLAVSSSAFYDLRTFPKDDKPRFVQSVLKGKRAMPAWEGTIKPEEVDAIWAYVGSVNGW